MKCFIRSNRISSNLRLRLYAIVYGAVFYRRAALARVASVVIIHRVAQIAGRFVCEMFNWYRLDVIAGTSICFPAKWHLCRTWYP